MSASAHRYTCDQLGVCQSRSTPCAGCQHPFAPGAITRHRSARRTAQLRELRKWLTVAALMTATAITIGLAAGYFVGA